MHFPIFLLGKKHNKISISPIKFQAQTDEKLINFSKWKHFFKMLLLLEPVHAELLHLDLCPSYALLP